ncbi:MAG TPA: acyl-CoA carboxylase subunit epsilon [Streptosporangiaceae bacterium]|nr:acyl-CoA carboxylase subunit epsilon [Streptosporangiaceae bacterium]
MTREDQAPPESEPTRPAGAPLLEVVAGHPSADELAALTVTLAALLAARDRMAGQAGQPRRAPSGWASRSRMLGAALRAGPDAWRRSTR